MKHWYFLLIIFVVLVGSIGIVAATDHLPLGLLRIQEQNNQDANDTLQNVSFLIAFVAGILTLLSPCVLPLLPAFFAYTFKEQKKITSMTFIFFLGFTLTFILLGLIAALIGDISITIFQQRISSLIVISGIVLIGLGVMTIFGKGFSGVPIVARFSHGRWGVFVYGILFAIGWTVCVGPILVGVLLMASILNNYFTAIYLMFFYALGIFVPLFLLSFLYDRYNLGQKSWIKGKEFPLLGYTVHSTKVIAGLLLIASGFIFIVYQGTGFINSIWFFGMKKYFYSVQEVLVANSIWVSIVGGIVLVGMIYGIWYFAWKKRK